jgi:cobalamin biosynthesis Mg chelatase CobN
MMRKGTSGGRRGFAIVAILLALAVAAPELAAPAGAAIDHSARRTELQTRPAARGTMTAAQKQKIEQYIRAHPQVLTKKKTTTKRRARVRKRRGRRRVSRKTRAARRKRAARKRRSKAKARSRKRKARRGAVAAKRRGKKAKRGHKKKKGGTSATTKLIHMIALLFLIGLPFIAVGLVLFGTDYRRRPRAPSNKKRRRVLVITPVGRKY